MDAMGQGNEDGPLGGDPAGVWTACRWGHIDRLERHQWLADRDRRAVPRADEPKALAVGHHDGTDQALGAPRQDVEIEAEQAVARGYGLPLADVRLESAALKGHRLQPDVHQDLGALHGTEGHGVAGAMDAEHQSRAGGVQTLAGRIYGDAVAQHALGEYWIGCLPDRQDPP